MNIPRLPDTELEIMKIIWENNEPTTSAHIMEKLEGKREWVLTTVLNFLARLVSRGFLTSHKKGKLNIYVPQISESAYLESESKSFLARLHGNSVTSFMASLYNGQALSKEDIEELREFIKAKEVGGAQL